MYLRNATNTRFHGKLEATGTPGRVTVGGRRALLWLLLTLQLCFICGFFVLQFSLNASLATNAGSTIISSGSSRAINWTSDEHVKFVTKLNKNEKDNTEMKFTTTRQTNEFAKDFFAANKRLTNETNDENNELLWCYRDGSIDETMQDSEGCKCRAGWHGNDCAQPEIIWRTLMMSGKKLQDLRLQKPTATVNAKHLIYFLQGHFFSLDMLELQLQALIEVVDYFIIFLSEQQFHAKQVRALQRSLKQQLQQKDYAFIQCQQLPAGKCDAATALQYWLHNKSTNLAWPLQAEQDLCLFTQEREILLPQALKYLKYYAVQQLPLLQFRLKYNVYGFYWQHPQLTQQSGLLSSLLQVQQQLQLPNDMRRQHASSVVLGDLNHFAGWYCEYCQQAEEIIAELHAATSSSSSSSLTTKELVQFPNITRNHHIDVSYLQHLIADGIYVKDARTQLLRVRRSSDAYYTPHYADAHSWKFGHLLTNLYENLYEDYVEYIN